MNVDYKVIYYNRKKINITVERDRSGCGLGGHLGDNRRARREVLPEMQLY